MTQVQNHYATVQRANGEYATAGTDAECADAAANQAEAVKALALAQCETPWDLHLKIRAAHDIARDESNDDGHFTDGRLALLMCAIERDAIAMARLYDKLEGERDEAQAVA
ncbi:MAG TPA: hypothetical protein VFA80_10380 [Xanthobacteraceae bacterium]|nr:hypothetical protein [Xanthobacteraceae bacterium]